jgi:hypothetical protein
MLQEVPSDEPSMPALAGPRLDNAFGRALQRHDEAIVRLTLPLVNASAAAASEFVGGARRTLAAAAVAAVVSTGGTDAVSAFTVPVEEQVVQRSIEQARRGSEVQSASSPPPQAQLPQCAPSTRTQHAHGMRRPPAHHAPACSPPTTRRAHLTM